MQHNQHLFAWTAICVLFYYYFAHSFLLYVVKKHFLFIPTYSQLDNLFVYCRVTVFEPGIIATPFIKQYGGIPADIFPKKAGGIPDEEMSKIVKEMVSFDPDLVMGSTWQEPEELAKQIEDIIMCETPDFRHQTSQLVKNLAKQQFADPTGNTVMNAWLKSDS